MQLEELLSPGYAEIRSPFLSVQKKVTLREPLTVECFHEKTITVGHSNFLLIQLQNTFDLPVEVKKLQISPMSGRALDEGQSEPILISDYFLVTFESSEPLPVILHRGSKFNISVIISPKPEAYNEFHKGSFSGSLEVSWNIPCLLTNISTSTDISWIGPKANDLMLTCSAHTPAILNEMFSVRITISNLSSLTRELTLKIGDIIEGNISREVVSFKGKQIERVNESKEKSALLPVFCLQRETRVGVVKPKSSTSVTVEFMPLKEGVFHVSDIKLVDTKNSQEFVNIRPYEILVVQERTKTVSNEHQTFSSISN